MAQHLPEKTPESVTPIGGKSLQIIHCQQDLNYVTTIMPAGCYLGLPIASVDFWAGSRQAAFAAECPTAAVASKWRTTADASWDIEALSPDRKWG